MRLFKTYPTPGLIKPDQTKTILCYTFRYFQSRSDKGTSSLWTSAPSPILAMTDLPKTSFVCLTTSPLRRHRNRWGNQLLMSEFWSVKTEPVGNVEMTRMSGESVWVVLAPRRPPRALYLGPAFVTYPCYIVTHILVPPVRMSLEDLNHIMSSLCPLMSVAVSFKCKKL